MKKTQLAIIVSSAIALTACGGSDGESTSSKDSFKYHIEGKAMVGHIKGAKVFLDLNYNGKLDQNEPKTITREDSRYYLALNNEQNECRDTAPIVALIEEGLVDQDNGEVLEEYTLTQAPTLLRTENGMKEVNITPLTDLTWDAYTFRNVSDCNNVTREKLVDFQEDIKDSLEEGVINQFFDIESVSDIYSDYKEKGFNIDPNDLNKVKELIIQAKKDKIKLDETEPLNNKMVSYKYFKEFNDIVKLTQYETETVHLINDEYHTLIRDTAKFDEIDQTTFSVIDNLKFKILESYPIQAIGYENDIHTIITAYKNRLNSNYSCIKNETTDVTQNTEGSTDGDHHSIRYVLQVVGAIEEMPDVQACIDEKITTPLNLNGSAVPSLFNNTVFRVNFFDHDKKSNGSFSAKSVEYNYGKDFDYDQFWSSDEIDVLDEFGDPMVDGDGKNITTIVWSQNEAWFNEAWIYHNKTETDYLSFFNLMNSFTYDYQGEYSESGSYLEYSDTEKGEPNVW